MDNPEEIEKVLTTSNKDHFSQSEGTSFTMEPLKDMLGPDSCTPFGNALLTGTVNMTNLPKSKLQKLYFTNLQRASGSLASPLPLTFLYTCLPVSASVKKAPLHPHRKDTSVTTHIFWTQTVMMTILKRVTSTKPSFKP